MTTTKRTSGGPDGWQERVTSRPDDTSLVSRARLASVVGVSNVAVITPALERLGIAPVDERQTTQTTVRNGGKGMRIFDTPYFDPAVADPVRAELRENAVDLGNGRHAYGGKTFCWIDPPRGAR